ncbi:hypothetical protein [Acaryochloris sp. IP29b_bin.148]|uniref:hypothetical protein n=1 Tax=Acaryochloris sp. IP29b_bin.148 TaxID=2969218 RepID=UPI00260B2172|nr:hypothetical protein [Acaryochloris sp. IP29b_bin.148]
MRPVNRSAVKFCRWLQQTRAWGDKIQAQEAGFALPLALGLGFVMAVLGVSMLMMAQSDRIASWQRKESNASLSLTEGGVARILAQFTAPNNAVLLNRNYDTINAKTGKTYLGPDGILNSGDETAQAIDEWTDYDPSNQPCHLQMGWGSPNFQTTGSIGSDGTYILRAYRYDPQQQQGTLLVESSANGQISGVLISISVAPDLDHFPGIVVSQNTRGAFDAGLFALRGREILGSKGNIYYNPDGSADSSLSDSAAPGDANRDDYLNAIWSTDDLDGADGDTVAGTIFACNVPPKLPTTAPGTNLGKITESQTIQGIGGKVPTLYQVEEIELDNEEVLQVDTTNGPVHIEVIDRGRDPELVITLRDRAKILNIRTDDQPVQVGDFRLLARGNSQINLYDQSCIQNAFLWFPYDELRLLTSGRGCPGDRNTNVEGVLWMEAILTAKNNPSNRSVNFLGGFNGTNYDDRIETGVTSGIAVPEDVSSLMDLLQYIDWPARYRFGKVQSWQHVRL